MLPIVFANSIQLYGGETKTIGIYDSTSLEKSCAQVFVIVNASNSIQFTSGGVREYSLANCEYHAGGSLVDNNKYFDLWVCDCTSGKFDLILSVLPNTVNTYVFSLAFYNESIIDDGNGEENENHLGGQTFVLTATSSRGGGACMTQWTCTEWDECDNFIQTRFCSYPLGFCEPNEKKPIEIKSCIMKEETKEEFQEILFSAPQSPGFFMSMTGAVIDTVGGGNPVVALIFVLALMTGFIVVVFQIRKQKLKNRL